MTIEELEFTIVKRESIELLVLTEIDHKKLEKKFEESTIKAIQKIVESQATPLDFFNLYADGDIIKNMDLGWWNVMLYSPIWKAIY